MVFDLISGKLVGRAHRLDHVLLSLDSMMPL